MVRYKRRHSPTQSNVVNRRAKRNHCKVDINVCSLTTLRKLRVPVKAGQSIVRYRQKNKCFTHINELLRIKAIDADTFKLLRTTCKVDTSEDELREILHCRRRSVRYTRSKTSLTPQCHRKLYKSKSDSHCQTAASNHRSSLPTLSRSCGTILSSYTKEPGCRTKSKQAERSKSMLSMLADMWGTNHKQRVMKHSDKRRSKSRSLLKCEKHKPAQKSSSLTARWVREARRRTALARESMSHTERDKQLCNDSTSDQSPEPSLRRSSRLCKSKCARNTGIESCLLM